MKNTKVMVQVSSLENTLVECVLKMLASALYFELYVTTGFTNAVVT